MITNSPDKPKYNPGLTGVLQQSIEYEPTCQDKQNPETIQTKPWDKTAAPA